MESTDATDEKVHSQSFYSTSHSLKFHYIQQDPMVLIGENTAPEDSTNIDDTPKVLTSEQLQTEDDVEKIREHL